MVSWLKKKRWRCSATCFMKQWSNVALLCFTKQVTQVVRWRFEFCFLRVKTFTCRACRLCILNVSVSHAGFWVAEQRSGLDANEKESKTNENGESRVEQRSVVVSFKNPIASRTFKNSSWSNWFFVRTNRTKRQAITATLNFKDSLTRRFSVDPDSTTLQVINPNSSSPPYIYGHRWT